MGITSMTRKAWTRCLPADNYPTHSALHYISGTFLPEDIWFYFSKYYLKHTDIVNLSSTCHYIRECLLPLLFARMSLVGGTIDYNPDPSLRRAITRIQHLRYYLRWLRSNLRILKHVRSVHVTNWLPLLVTPWSLHGRFTVHVSGNARRSLSGLWKSAFQELADFIASIPSLESITFCEGFVQAYGGSSPFNIPHTWTRDTVSLLEFEIIHGRNPSELFKFCQTEETLFQPANRLGIEIDYFLSLLRYNDFRVISAILPGHLVLHIPQPLLGRLHTLRKLRLGLSLQKEFPIEMKNLVEDILSSICPLLRSVDISLDRQNLQPLHLRPDMLPPVEELIAPPPIIQQLMSTGTYARVSTLRVRETRWVAMAAMFSSSHYPVMDSVTTLDLSSLSSINRLLLDDIAKVCSRLETLVLGAPQGSTSIHRDHAEIMGYFLKCAAPFTQLKFLNGCYLTYPLDSDRIERIEDPISQIRSHPTLLAISIINFGEYCWIDGKGWFLELHIPNRVPPIASDKAVDRILRTLYRDSLTGRKRFSHYLHGNFIRYRADEIV